MKAVSKGQFKTIVQAPKGVEIKDLEKKAKQYIKEEYEIKVKDK
jgi:hypothetical protein